MSGVTATGEVTSKPDALRWAMEALDPRWRPLLQRTLDERSRGWEIGTPADPTALAETRALVAEGIGLAERSSP